MQNQAYSQQAVYENEDLIVASVNKLMQRMRTDSNDKSFGTTDMFKLCTLFSFEVICKAAFNKDISATSDEHAMAFLRDMDGSAMTMIFDSILPFLNWRRMGERVPGFLGEPYRHYASWVEMTRSLSREFSRSAKIDGTERFLATSLLNKQDTYLNRYLTEDEAVGEAMGIAFAGSGTTSTTLVYIFYNLSKPDNQSFQDKLFAEIQTAGTSLHELSRLPYLSAVIKKTMRLNPTIISTLPRVLDIPLMLDDTGVVLPTGTEVGMGNLVHHRNPSTFHDPHSFNPDRWLDSRSPLKEMEESLTPFSLGPHNCIGQNLARAELYLAVSGVCRNFHLSINSAMSLADMHMVDRFNIAPKGSKLILDFKERA